MEITVAVVIDDARLRAAFAHAVLCTPGLTLLGAGADLASGRSLLDAQRPDVLLVDLELPNCFELIRHAAQYRPGCEVMAVTSSQNMGTVLEAIKAGATGFVSREIDGLSLAEDLRMLHAGGSPMPPLIARQLLHILASPDAHTAARSGGELCIAPLSAQERKVLEIASKGYIYDDVAKLMGVSRETVLTYAKRIHRKLNVHSKTEAIYEARCLGWLAD
jgi:DNA-binding NarL/FixJ family response regulator